MALKYDFDLVPVLGDHAHADPGKRKSLESAGLGKRAAGNFVASFRDPRTADALRGADDNVRAFFREAGFGFQPSGGKLPPYYIDPDHLDQMDEIMERISAAHEKADLAGAHWNGFDFWAFLDCALKSNPAPRKMAAAARPASKKSGGPSFGTQLLRFTIFFIVAFILIWQLTEGAGEGLLDSIIEAVRLQIEKL